MIDEIMMNNEIIMAKEVRILNAIVRKGIPAVPMDFYFLKKYNLSDLYITVVDIRTSTKNSRATLLLVNRLKSRAQGYLPDNIYTTDRTLLSTIFKHGFWSIQILFPGDMGRYPIEDFLTDYNLLDKYNIFLSLTSQLPNSLPQGYVNEVSARILQLDEEIKKDISNIIQAHEL